MGSGEQLPQVVAMSFEERSRPMLEQAPYNCGRCPTPCTCLEVDRCLQGNDPRRASK